MHINFSFYILEIVHFVSWLFLVQRKNNWATKIYPFYNVADILNPLKNKTFLFDSLDITREPTYKKHYHKPTSLETKMKIRDSVKAYFDKLSQDERTNLKIKKTNLFMNCYDFTTMYFLFLFHGFFFLA